MWDLVEGAAVWSQPQGLLGKNNGFGTEAGAGAQTPRNRLLSRERLGARPGRCRQSRARHRFRRTRDGARDRGPRAGGWGVLALPRPTI